MDINDILGNDLVKYAVNNLVPELVTDVRFRSNFTDEVVLLKSDDVLDLINGVKRPPSETSKKVTEALAVAKPTLILNSKQFGTRVWAPYGQADAKMPAIWQGKLKFWLWGGLGVLFVAGFTLGRISKKGVYDDRPDRGAFGRD